MRINKGLHHAHGFDRIGLIQFRFRGLFIIRIGSHEIHFFCPRAIGKDLEITLKKIFGIHVITQIVGAVGILVVNIFEFLTGLIVGHYIFINLLGKAPFLLCEILLSHSQFISGIGILKKFGNAISATAGNENRDNKDQG